jgi:hypothetical protein
MCPFGLWGENVILAEFLRNRRFGERFPRALAKRRGNGLQQLGGCERHEDEVRVLSMRLGLEHRVGDAAGDQGGHFRVVAPRPEDEMQSVVLPEPQVSNQYIGGVLGQERLRLVEAPSRAYAIPRPLEKRDRIGPVEGVAINDYYGTRDCHKLMLDRTAMHE